MICKNCGREFILSHGQQVYCSSECQKGRKNSPYTPKLLENVLAARHLGMTYGQYMAEKFKGVI